MKTLWPLLAVLMMVSTSHALISDRFSCKIKIIDTVTSTSSEQQQDFFVARLPMSASPSPNIRLTTGQSKMRLSLDSPKAILSANVNFYYKHAVRLDEIGVPVEARQMSCVGLLGGYCSKHGGDMKLCGEGQVGCMDSFDPFDPVKGWSPTSLVENMPIFNERALGPMLAVINDDAGTEVGKINFECKYQGTFQ